MPFQYYEWLALLRADGMTFQKLSEHAGRSERYIRLVKNGRQPMHQGRWEQNLSRIAFERLDLSWPIEAQEQMNEILDLHRSKRFSDIDRLFTFSGQMMLEHVRAFDPKSAVSATPALWGQTLSAFWVIYALRSSKNTALSSKFSAADWGRVTSLLHALLNTKPQVAWVALLRFKITFPCFELRWNALDAKGDGRCSHAMREWLDKTNMRRLLLAYHDVVPERTEAPFNALAIASRFRERSCYPDLLRRLQEADARYRTVSGIESMKKADKDLNEDFVDFLGCMKTDPRLVDMFQKEVA